MQNLFPNIERAKKSAKAIASVSDNISLSAAQRAVAKISGCRDWHDLDALHKRGSLNNSCESRQYPDSQGQDIGDLALRLSDELGTDWSTALYALSIAHIPGFKLDSLGDYEAVWLRLMYEKFGFSNHRKSVGSIVKLKVPDRMGSLGYLRAHGRPTHLVTHVSIDTVVADFQVTIPRYPVAPFIPARLKYAYGCWTEKDGAQVLFSRDYKPLWRIRKGRKPERLQPWLWIEYYEENHFWGDVNWPWNKKARQEEEEKRLLDFGVTALPKLTEVLPEAILRSDLHSVDDAVNLIAKREDSEVIETYHGFIKVAQRTGDLDRV